MGRMETICRELGCEASEVFGMVLELVAATEELRAARVRAEQEVRAARAESWELMRAHLAGAAVDMEFMEAAREFWMDDPWSVNKVLGVEVVKADNPYGCNQYGEGWKEEHNGNSTKYEQTGFSGKVSKMLTNTAGGNKVSVATKEKKPGKGAYPDASEEGLKKAAEPGEERKAKEPEDKKTGSEKHPIGKAVTRSEAIEHSKELMGEGGTVYFDDSITLEMINEFNSTIQGLFEKYGQFGMKNMGSVLRNGGIGACANEWKIEINHDHGTRGVHGLKDWKTYGGRTVEGYTRHNVGATENGISLKDVITHEFGHVIQSLLSRQYDTYLEQKRYWGEQATKEYYEREGELEGIEAMAEWRKALGKARRSKYITQVSEYANTNDREFFSECLAMRERGEELPEYITLAMDRIIRYKQKQYEKKAA